MISLKDIRPYIGPAQDQMAISGRGIERFLKEHEAEGGLDLDPDFQRGHVWTDVHRTRYLEHLLRGGQHGRVIVWNSPTYAYHDRRADTDLPTTLVIVDGKQRLTAVRMFLDDRVGVFGGNRLSDFDEQSQRDILISTSNLLRLTMHMHGLQYRRELLDLYLQLNEGAIAHSPEELDRVRALRDATSIPESLR
jgi:hypothetical protein